MFQPVEGKFKSCTFVLFTTNSYLAWVASRMCFTIDKPVHFLNISRTCLVNPVKSFKNSFNVALRNSDSVIFNNYIYFFSRFSSEIFIVPFPGVYFVALSAKDSQALLKSLLVTEYFYSVVSVTSKILMFFFCKRLSSSIVFLITGEIPKYLLLILTPFEFETK